MKIAEALRDVRRLFLDTAPVIYHIEGIATYQPLTDFVFQRISDGTYDASTSPITLAECLVHPFQKQDLALVQKFRNVITAGAHTHFVSLDASAENAAEFRVRYNLSLTDAFQVAAAVADGCDAFLTNDLELKRVQEITVFVIDELDL